MIKMTKKRFTITQDFDEHERQIRDNGKIIMGCFIQPQAEPIVKLLNELHEENIKIKNSIQEAYTNERTALGRSVLKQLLNKME